ncbi:PAS domain-containing protein [Dongia sp.]|uniref:PAS domain-containing protein n=1 Tax=Dongia sp. TaxID=1977262 RepID=UPI0035B4C199
MTTDIHDPPTLAADPRFGRLLRHVAGKRGDRRWARRADIDASEIPGLLPHIWMIEIERPGDCNVRRLRVRLAGTRIENVYGRALSGLYLEEMDWGTYSPRILNSLTRMADEGIGHFLDAAAMVQPRLSRRVRRLGLPLSDDDERPSHLLLLAYYEFNASAPEHFNEMWLDGAALTP